jgi:S1-C subfamily serine protease
MGYMVGIAKYGIGLLATAFAALVVVGHLAHASTTDDPIGASPGERDAIRALCNGDRAGALREMCVSNQLQLILRLGRKPDLSVASAAQQSAVAAACGGKSVPAERFACERTRLSALGLPVRDEPGGGNLTPKLASVGSPVAVPTVSGLPRPAAVPFFSLEKWRLERPPMPTARGAEALSGPALYQRVGPSIYVVMASDHALELAARTGYSQGSAVAITDHIALTNCHVVVGHPQISISQNGEGGKAILVYADPAGDRCFLKSDTLVLHPIQGVRRFADIRVGEPVFSVGTPIGLERTFGEGIVTGLRQFEGVRIVQNSAPTWHGSSGGGLFDARGNLVGITTAISVAAPNLNFALAAEDFWP